MAPIPPARRLAPIIRDTLETLVARQLSSRTFPDGPTRLPLAGRQAVVVATSTVPSTYGALNAGPDPGTVVGITLGAVGGFLIFVYLIYMCMSFGGPADGASSIGTASVVTRKSRRASRNHHHHHRPRRETVEVRRATSTSRGGGAILVDEVITPSRDRVERIVVEESRRRSTSRPPPPIVPHPPPGPILSDDDEVVVIEEHSPPRRHRSKRRSASGYRDIDPDRFAGGDSHLRDVRRSRRVSRDR